MKIKDRLKNARESAGHKSVQDAVDAHRWKYPTYSAHENGSRTPNAETIQTYAKAFGVDPAWLQFGTGTEKRSAQRQYGFSESEAEFIHKSQTPKEVASVPDVNFKVSRDHMPFGILSGDFLSIDLKSPAKDGDIVVANMVDHDAATGITVIRRLAGDFLVSSSPTDPLINMTSETISVTGTIRLVIRSNT